MIWTVIVAFALIAALAGLIRLAEPRLAFFPMAGEDSRPDDLGALYTPLTITTADGEQLRAWHLPRADARAQVLYFHGNGGNLSLWIDILVDMWRHGFDLVAVDYRGYGLSTGAPTERGLYQDVEAVLARVHGELRRADVPLLYWGRSLGATMAAYAASQREPHGVILEAGFPSARDVFASNPAMWALSWLASYRFPTLRWMADVGAPVLVLHGDADTVIPYRSGRRLYEGLRGPKEMVTIRGGDHNDVSPRDPAVYWSAIDRLVTRAASGQ